MKQRIHYLGTIFASRTACGRYVNTYDEGEKIRFTDDLLAVTCEKCRKLI